MIRTAKVVRTEVGTNKDGDTEVRLVVGELTSEDDLQNVEFYDGGGRDYRPPDNTEIVVLDISPSFRVALAVDDTVDKKDTLGDEAAGETIFPGEQEIYATNNNTVKTAWQRFLRTGQIEINGRGDYAVRFDELNEQIAQLRQDFNDFVADYNAHLHGIPALLDGTGTPCTITPGPALGNTVTATAQAPNADDTEIDIATAKVDNVEFEDYEGT